MKLLRIAALVAAIVTLPSLLQSVTSIPHNLEWMLMEPGTAFGLFCSEIFWFAYFSQYRHSKQVLFILGWISFPLTLLTVLGYLLHSHIAILDIFTPKDSGYMLNLAITFSAYYLIQILYRWLPKTTVYINGLLAIILFIAILSVSGHLYNFDTVVDARLLMPIPPVAIVAFLILGLSIFIDANHMERLYLNKKIVASFTLMLIAIMAANVVVYKNFNNTVETAGMINTTRQTLADVYELDIMLDRVGTDAQTYSNTGAASTLHSYYVDKQAYSDAIVKLEGKSSQSSSNTIRTSVKSIDSLGSDILHTTDMMIVQRQKGVYSPAVRSTTDNQLDAYMDQMLKNVRAVTGVYTDELNKLAVKEAYGGRGIITGVSISSALSVLLIIFTPLFIRQTIRKLSMTQERLKKSYRQLSEEKSRVEAILTSIGDGIFAVNNDNHITMFNPAAEELSGLAATDVIGRDFAKALHFSAGNGDKQLLQFVSNALAGTETQITRNLSLSNKDGKKMDVQLSASPVKDHRGVVRAAIVVFRDRSQEQALENAKDDFASLASHQLRTPATATKQFLAMFLQGYAGTITDRQRLFLQEAYDNNELEINIIEELLNITRLESNQIKLNIEHIDAVAIVQKAAESHRKLAEKSQHKLVVHTPSSPVLVSADVSMLHMVLDNLLTNAIKYTLPGGAVTLELEQKDTHVIIRISDTGIGIKPADLSRIFGRFSRLEDPSIRHVSGTGIGLYLVHKIVDMHHATIEVSSVYGKGSTFTIDFNENGE
jgi:two-component system phosphate regulon sensor histidine kinase PhoR